MNPKGNFERILVPLDFSENSQKALEVASQLAHANKSEVHLMHVITHNMSFVPVGGPLPSAHVESMLHPTQEELESKLEEVSVAPQLNEPDIKRTVVEGVPADSIVQYAKTHDIDLIVMATHGHTGLTRLLMGSVAESVVRNADCPVLTLKPH